MDYESKSQKIIITKEMDFWRMEIIRNTDQRKTMEPENTILTAKEKKNLLDWFWHAQQLQENMIWKFYD